MSTERETDIEIARLLGWKEHPVGTDVKGEHGGGSVLLHPGTTDEQQRAMYEYLPRRGAVPMGWFVPEYASSVDRMFELIATMRQRGWNFDLANRGDDWSASFVHGHNEHTDYEAWAKTAPLAVATAALAALSAGTKGEA